MSRWLWRAFFVVTVLAVVYVALVLWPQLVVMK